MRSLLLTAFLASALLPLAGCNLYFSGGDGDPPCDEWGGGSGGGAQPAPELLRNPDTGVCEEFYWGGGPNPPYPCDGVCGPCAGTGVDTTPDSSTPDTSTTPPSETGGQPSGSEDAEAPALSDPVELPTWGHCDSYCTGLDEQGCLATNGCRGIYEPGAPDAPEQFRECWETDYSDVGVVDCENLDAYSCSTSDACVAVHQFACDGGSAGDPNTDQLEVPECGPGPFLACHNEPTGADGCYGNEDCGEGFSCNAADVCLPPPGSGNGDQAVPSVCYGYCVPDVIDPGECDGDVLCESLPPLCEAGTTPGIANGCWTGACIDLSLCPQTACGDIQGESMCIARDDCSAYYVGDDCSCDANGCTCGQWLFDSCAQGAP